MRNEEIKEREYFPQWFYWIIATATAALTLTAFVYANFPTRTEFNSLGARLDRIEDKLDRALSR